MLNAAVLGSPIAHSLSPLLHRAAYRALGLEQWRYAAHEVDEVAFLPFVAGLDASWRGLSLTMPLKEVAFEVASEVSAAARATGAVNTLVRRATGEWDAHNTDVHGIVAALAPAGARGCATVLGSGATARSAIAALQQLGVSQVRVAVRSGVRPETARMSAALGVHLDEVALDHWADEGGLVVSTLPASASTSAAEALAGRVLEGTLLDVVYAGWPTPLARAASGAGLTVVSGLAMLVHQAAEQVRLMTGHEPPLDAMLAAAGGAVAG